MSGCLFDSFICIAMQRLSTLIQVIIYVDLKQDWSLQRLAGQNCNDSPDAAVCGTNASSSLWGAAVINNDLTRRLSVLGFKHELNWQPILSWPALQPTTYNYWKSQTSPLLLWGRLRPCR
uniref:Uncharacterized protein n=1 Tax=Cryptomonas curvata TaxID=233186 RepID=A0A7S0LZR3_9CRYP|mmetsp:Transcript_18052/g.38111  ORF Transcript_18052/g.38111 Transcript_18052/m.38111 type:complete len:120 (+) Transcript_18052:312-671(+)